MSKLWTVNRAFLFSLAVLTVLFTLGSTSARADTITVKGISYTFTSSVDSADPGNVFDVTLTIDTTHATASGKLSSFAVKFAGATDVNIESDNAGIWTDPKTGPNSAGGCKSTSGDFWCMSTLSGLTVTAGGSGNGIYTFAFDVTMPSGKSLPKMAKIEAFQGGALKVSSNDRITFVPEPATAALLGSGLVGLLGLFHKRRSILGA